MRLLPRLVSKLTSSVSNSGSNSSSYSSCSVYSFSSKGTGSKGVVKLRKSGDRWRTAIITQSLIFFASTEQLPHGSLRRVLCQHSVHWTTTLPTTSLKDIHPNVAERRMPNIPSKKGRGLVETSNCDRHLLCVMLARFKRPREAWLDARLRPTRARSAMLCVAFTQQTKQLARRKSFSWNACGRVNGRRSRRLPTQKQRSAPRCSFFYVARTGRQTTRARVHLARRAPLTWRRLSQSVPAYWASV